MNSMPKFVVSTKLRAPAWNNSTALNGDVAEEAGRLKRDVAGEMLVIGSRMLVHALMRHDLVDEYRLMVAPILLGSGRRLFPDSPDKRALRLVNTLAFDSGVVIHTYRPAA
jgi:dihydrofolate reductase